MATWDDELAALTAQRGQALTGYAYLLCGNRRDAEDVVQDALVKVFSRLRGRGPTASRQPAPTSPSDQARRIKSSTMRLRSKAGDSHIRI